MSHEFFLGYGTALMLVSILHVGLGLSQIAHFFIIGTGAIFFLLGLVGLVGLTKK